MFSPETFSSRRNRLMKCVQQDGGEAILITNLPNIFYFSGFRGSDGALLVTSLGATLLVDGRYGTQAAQQAPSCDIIVYPDKVAGITECVRKSGIVELLFESKTVAFELIETLQSALPSVHWRKPGPWFVSIRAQKDPQEWELLRKANRIADEAAEAMLSWIKPGTMERDVATELEYQMKKRGAEKASFSILVAGGGRASLPHAQPTDRKIQPRELFFIDFGCTLDGYNTDQTLTLCFGEPEPKFRKLYELCKDAHDAAASFVAAGVSARDVDGKARKVITDAGYGDRFTHGTGHGIGIEVHEFPSISWKSDSILEVGNTLTIEPGIYLPNEGGVRIEDTLLITDSGVETLTTLDKGFRSL